MNQHEGIIKKMDSLGRIVIPAEIREELDIRPSESVMLSVDCGFVKIRKIGKNCVFCNNTRGLVNYCGKTVCSRCIDKIYDLIN